MNVVKTVELNARDGRKVTIELSDVLAQRIVEAYGLGGLDQVQTRHVEEYLVSSMSKALES